MTTRGEGLVSVAGGPRGTRGRSCHPLEGSGETWQGVLHSQPKKHGFDESRRGYGLCVHSRIRGIPGRGNRVISWSSFVDNVDVGEVEEFSQVRIGLADGLQLDVHTLVFRLTVVFGANIFVT